MLDLKFVRSNLDSIRAMLKNRQYDLDVSRFEDLDQERRKRLTVLEELRHRRNHVTDKIAAMKKRGEDASAVISEMKEVSSSIKEREKELPRFVEELNELLMVIPNMPHESVVVGKDEEDNPVMGDRGKPRYPGFCPCVQAGRIQVCNISWLGCKARKSAHQLHAGYSHKRAWIYRNTATVHG